MIGHLAVVVEGESGFGAVPVLLRNAGVSARSVIKFPGQAVDCPIHVLVDRCLARYAMVAVLKNPDKVIVVLDREYRSACPGEFAGAVETELKSQLSDKFGYSGFPTLVVVCSDRKLENWLIADPGGVAAHANIRQNFASKVGGNADSKNAEAILKASYRSGVSYQKRKDAPQLAALVRVGEKPVRRRSKSLDKLLREAGV